MKIPKSYWYYWYTGNKPVAVISMILSAAVTGLVLALSVGFSIWGIILAVLLDSLGFLVVLIYVALRLYPPSLSYLPNFVLEQGDLLVLYQFVIPICIVLVVGRLITFLVAKFESQWSKKGLIALVGMVIVCSSAVVLKIQYDQKKALEEAAAQPGKVEVLKAAAIQITSDAAQSVANAANDVAESTSQAAGQAKEAAGKFADDATLAVTNAANDAAESTSQAAGQAKEAAEKLADDAANSVSQTADGAKQKLSDTCKSLADSLGKNPDEYCK